MSGLFGRVYRGETKIDFLGKRKIWYTVSTVFLLASIVLLWSRGLNYGIEFAGGVSIVAPIGSTSELAEAEDLEVIQEVRAALEPFGAGQAQVQVSRTGDERTVLVQTKEVADPEEQQKVVDAVGKVVDAPPGGTDSERIGSKWGGEITEKALRALVIFLVVMVAFISIRFEWKMAVGAFMALAHDLIITAGVYSAVGFAVTPSTVIAILTILGYSLYDTIVVFDKVEENANLYATTGKMTYQDSANLAMNQVFMRSLNTSLSSLLPVAALLFIGVGLLGAGTLEDLALALFVGMLASTYSSIFVATPILTQLKEHEPRYKNIREKVLRDAKRVAAAPTPAMAAATAGGSDGSDQATPIKARSGGGASRPASKSQRARAGSKKAKRRKRR